MTPPSKSRVSQRIAAIAESATLAVDAKAKALKAAGKPVIGFGAGEPDFPTPDYIVEAAVAAAKNPSNHRYTPTPGLPELREAIVRKTKRDSGYEITADQSSSPMVASNPSTNHSPRSLIQAMRYCFLLLIGLLTQSASNWQAVYRWRSSLTRVRITWSRWNNLRKH